MKNMKLTYEELVSQNENLKKKLEFSEQLLSLANEELFAKEIFFNRVIDQSPFATWISDSEGTMIKTNPALLKFLNLTYEQLVGKYNVFEDAIAQRENLMPAIKTVFEEGKTISFVVEWDGRDMPQMDLKGSKSVICEGTMFPIHNNEGILTNVALVWIDITQRTNAEKELIKYKNELEITIQERTEELRSINEELKATNEELYDKNKTIEKQYNEIVETIQKLKNAQFQLIQSDKMASLGVLTAGVAHEINNPLNYIQSGLYGLNKLFNKQLKVYKEETLHNLNAIEEGIKRVAKIVTSLNQFSRDDINKDEDCNINSVIDNCLIMLHHKLKFRVEVVKNYYEEIPIIKGNTGQLHQAILNIIANAEQAIEEEGQIKIATNLINENIKIEISDSGSGISEENLTKIIEPFFTTKEPGKGTGLGMSITYKIIKEHGGTLDIQSKINEGTIVIITLPAS